MRRRLGGAWVLAAAAVIAAAVAGCGFDVKSPDLFLLTRTGQGTKLTLLVNDSGTIRCNGAKARKISDPLLISARDLSDNMNQDVTAKVKLPAHPATVFSYRVRLQAGTIAFSDRDSRQNQDLAQAVLFAAQAAQQACGLAG